MAMAVLANAVSNRASLPHAETVPSQQMNSATTITYSAAMVAAQPAERKAVRLMRNVRSVRSARTATARSVTQTCSVRVVFVFKENAAVVRRTWSAHSARVVWMATALPARPGCNAIVINVLGTCVRSSQQQPVATECSNPVNNVKMAIDGAATGAILPASWKLVLSKNAETESS